MISLLSAKCPWSLNTQATRIDLPNTFSWSSHMLTVLPPSLPKPSQCNALYRARSYPKEKQIYAEAVLGYLKMEFDNKRKKKKKKN